MSEALTAPRFDNVLDLPADPFERFWTARPVLDHIRTYARARRAGPWAVLGAVLARTVAATDPNLMLPELTGVPASLNLFVVLVGKSGGGKGIAEGVARHAVTFADGMGAVEIEEYPIGSGEGIARTFMPAPRESDAPAPTRAILSAPEIDTVVAIGGRQGSTLMAELRKVYSGESIGFTNANRATRTAIDAHAYRACMILGAQPLKSGPLFSDAAGGTPQRCLFLTVYDHDSPEEAPATPDAIVVKIERYGDRDQVHMPFPDEVHQEFNRYHWVRVRGDEIDELDGHKMLTRAKVAAALAILDERYEVSAEDWSLAGTIVHSSDRTRAEMVAAVAEQSRAANRARAIAKADHDEMIGDRKFERARDRIVHWLGKAPLSRSDLHRKLKDDIRPQFSAAVAELVDRQTVREYQDNGKTMFALTGQGHVSQGTRGNKPVSTSRDESVSLGTRVPVSDAGTLCGEPPASLSSRKLDALIVELRDEQQMKFPQIRDHLTEQGFRPPQAAEWTVQNIAHRYNRGKKRQAATK